MNRPTQHRADVVLASQSPRRRELLAQLGLQVEVIRVEVAEVPGTDEEPAHYNQRVAIDKAQTGWAASAQALPVLGADTEVVIGKRVFGKPRDASQAAAMLHDLSGRSHQVITAVAVVRSDGQLRSLQQISEVTFAELNPAQIQAYCDSGEALGKAGAYAIQGQAAAFISHLAGSFSGVMGLPLFETARLLHWAGLKHPLLAAQGNT